MTTDEAPGVDLPALVTTLAYKPGWAFKIGGPGRRFLCIFATTENSRRPGQRRTTQHMFEVPPLDTEPAALRWTFDCLLLCELHEAGEFFTAGDRRPFYPHHEDEGSPYELVDRTEHACP